MTHDDEHQELVSSATDLLSVLRELRGRLAPVGDVEHYQHSLFADRCSSLAAYLEAAVGLINSTNYAGAFALLRVALEHHVFDALLFLADRYEERYVGVSQEDYRLFCDQLAAGEAPGVLDHEYSSGSLRVVKRGIAMQDSPDETLSIYYALFEQVDPFVGTKAEQRELAPQFAELDARERMAERNEELRAGRLGWARLVRSLVMNGLLAEADATRLQVHYRFLGAYVHPTSRASHELLRKRGFWVEPFDHYSSELILLYVITLAAREIRAFKTVTERPPVVGLDGWLELEGIVRHGEATADYLWFPGGTPTAFDRVQEANTRGRVGRQWVPREGREPDSIPDDEIRYYSNPLRRLVDMHCSSVEFSGFAYVSPWHREDALFR